jgi:hypothetical protein
MSEKLGGRQVSVAENVPSSATNQEVVGQKAKNNEGKPGRDLEKIDGLPAIDITDRQKRDAILDYLRGENEAQLKESVGLGLIDEDESKKQLSASMGVLEKAESGYYASWNDGNASDKKLQEQQLHAKSILLEGMNDILEQNLRMHEEADKKILRQAKNEGFQDIDRYDAVRNSIMAKYDRGEIDESTMDRRIKSIDSMMAKVEEKKDKNEKILADVTVTEKFGIFAIEEIEAEKKRLIEMNSEQQKIDEEFSKIKQDLDPDDVDFKEKMEKLSELKSKKDTVRSEQQSLEKELSRPEDERIDEKALKIAESEKEKADERRQKLAEALGIPVDQIDKTLASSIHALLEENRKNIKILRNGGVLAGDSKNDPKADAGKQAIANVPSTSGGGNPAKIFKTVGGAGNIKKQQDTDDANADKLVKKDDEGEPVPQIQGMDTEPDDDSKPDAGAVSKGEIKPAVVVSPNTTKVVVDQGTMNTSPQKPDTDETDPQIKAPATISVAEGGVDDAKTDAKTAANGEAQPTSGAEPNSKQTDDANIKANNPDQDPNKVDADKKREELEQQKRSYNAKYEKMGSDKDSYKELTEKGGSVLGEILSYNHEQMEGNWVDARNKLINAKDGDNRGASVTEFFISQITNGREYLGMARNYGLDDETMSVYFASRIMAIKDKIDQLYRADNKEEIWNSTLNNSQSGARVEYGEGLSEEEYKGAMSVLNGAKKKLLDNIRSRNNLASYADAQQHLVNIRDKLKDRIGSVRAALKTDGSEIFTLSDEFIQVAGDPRGWEGKRRESALVEMGKDYVRRFYDKEAAERIERFSNGGDIYSAGAVVEYRVTKAVENADDTDGGYVLNTSNKSYDEAFGPIVDDEVNIRIKLDNEKIASEVKELDLDSVFMTARNLRGEDARYEGWYIFTELDDWAKLLIEGIDTVRQNLPADKVNSLVHQYWAICGMRDEMKRYYNESIAKDKDGNTVKISGSEKIIFGFRNALRGIMRR